MARRDKILDYLREELEYHQVRAEQYARDLLPEDRNSPRYEWLLRRWKREESTIDMVCAQIARYRAGKVGKENGTEDYKRNWNPSHDLFSD